MNMTRGGCVRDALSARKDDLYETPPIATRALLRHEALSSHIWEPACGRGAICDVLSAAGKSVTATDLVDYGYGRSGVDFLMETRAPDGCDTIVTNPPYKLADEFIWRGLTLVPRIIVLLRLAFLEGAKRRDLHSKHLERVWLGAERLPMMHRDGFEAKRAGASAMPFAWFVFNRYKAPAGPAPVHFISWREHDT